MQFRRFETEGFDVSNFRLLDPEAGPLPGIPGDWRRRSLDFLGGSVRQMLGLPRAAEFPHPTQAIQE